MPEQSANEAVFMMEGMMAIRRLAVSDYADSSMVIGKIADAMHNGFSPEDEIGLRQAAQIMHELQLSHPELARDMPNSLAWAANLDLR